MVIMCRACFRASSGFWARIAKNIFVSSRRLLRLDTRCQLFCLIY